MRQLDLGNAGLVNSLPPTPHPGPTGPLNCPSAPEKPKVPPPTGPIQDLDMLIGPVGKLSKKKGLSKAFAYLDHRQCR